MKLTVLNKALLWIQQSEQKTSLLSAASRAKKTTFIACTKYRERKKSERIYHFIKHTRTHSHMPSIAVGGPQRGRNTLMDNDRV